TKFEAMHLLCEAGVPASAVFDTMDVFTDPHLNARNFIQKVPHPEHGEITLMDCPARLSESKVPLRAAPLLGADTAAVLQSDLGLRAEELRRLHEEGAIICHEHGASAERAVEV